jgi:hypothetical protein
MRRFPALILFSTAIALPASAGEATFADGRGRLTLEGGIVDMTLAPIDPDGMLSIDGASVDFGATADRLHASTVGGAVSFVLPGEDAPAWLGRALRLSVGFERASGDQASLQVGAGPTLDTNLTLISASIDGRALATVSNDIAGVVAFAHVSGPGTGLTGSCSDTTGSASALATFTSDNSGFTGCSTTAASAEATAYVSTGNSSSSAAANGFVLTVPQQTGFYVQKARSVDARRGAVTLEGDHDAGTGLVLSPSVSVVAGRTVSTFLNSQTLAAPDYFWAMRHVSGRIESDDIGMGIGATLRQSFADGFDVFAGARASALRRRTHLNALSQTELGFILDVDPDLNLIQVAETRAMVIEDGIFARAQRHDTIAAFQGMLEAGAGYRFDSGVIGPLRLAVTGAVTYDSDVATYGNIGVPQAIDATPPLAPTHIAYSGEHTFALKAELTFELP